MGKGEDLYVDSTFLDSSGFFKKTEWSIHKKFTVMDELPSARLRISFVIHDLFKRTHEKQHIIFL